MNILIVDDSKTVLRINERMCKDVLTGSGEVHTALDGQIAQDVLNKESIGLVLLDINMPVCVVYKFLGDTVARREELGTKVVMCTTEGAKSDVIKALRLGACDYLVKPITREVLASKLVKYVR